jgi:hypothetical protein
MKRLILFLPVLLLFTCSYGQGIIRANGFARAISTGSYTPTDEDVQAYIVGLSTPIGASTLEKIDDFIIALKDSLNIINMSDYFDVFYIYANDNEEAALRNLVERDNDCTNQHSSTFTATEGFTFDGANDYLNTTYNASSEATVYALSSASMGMYKRSGDNGLGGINPSGTVSGAVLQTVGNYVKLNNYGWFADFGGSSVNGICIVDHIGADQIVYYQNKTKYTGALGQIALPNGNMFVGALNVDGNAGNFGASQTAIFYVGKKSTDAEANDISDCFEAFMDSLGKGVL